MRMIQTAIVFVLAASPLVADDVYKFHVSLGTVEDGLRAVNPKDPLLEKLGQDRLQEAALVFKRIGGDHGWRATFRNCPKKPMRDCEARVNSASLGGADRESDPGSDKGTSFDLGFSDNGDGTMRARCLRSSCQLLFGKEGATESRATLQFGESKDLPLDVDIEASFR